MLICISAISFLSLSSAAFRVERRDAEGRSEEEEGSEAAPMVGSRADKKKLKRIIAAQRQVGGW